MPEATRLGARELGFIHPGCVGLSPLCPLCQGAWGRSSIHLSSRGWVPFLPMETSAPRPRPMGPQAWSQAAAPDMRSCPWKIVD